MKKEKPLCLSRRVFVFGEGEDARGVSYLEQGKATEPGVGAQGEPDTGGLRGMGLPFYSSPHAGTSHRRAHCALGVSPSPSVQRGVPFSSLPTARSRHK